MTPEGSSAWDALINDLDRVTAERDAMGDALLRFGKHWVACYLGDGAPLGTPGCTCGFQEAVDGSWMGWKS